MTDNSTPPVRLRPEIAALGAYRQGRPAAAGGYKLSSNENPFDPLPGVLEAVAAAGGLNRYPDGAAVALRTRLAERYGVALDEVHAGAGSVSILAQLIAAAAAKGDEVVYAWRSFEAYPGLITVAGATGVPVPNRADGSHDTIALAAAVTERTRLLIVCSPNNPTGTAVSAAEFAELMQSVPTDLLVILDEAYLEFGRDPAAVSGDELLGRYPNLVLLRTFSKAWGLAALRIGYAIGPAAILDAARATSIPLSVTDQAQQAAIASLGLEDELIERVEHIVRRREEVWDGLVRQGWLVPKPSGNFVWLPAGAQTDLAADILYAHGLTGRAFPPEGLRVSIGEEESVAKLLTASAEIVDNLPNGHPGLRLD